MSMIITKLSTTCTVESFLFMGPIIMDPENFAGSWGHNFLGDIFLNHNARQFIILLNIPGDAIIHG